MRGLGPLLLFVVALLGSPYPARAQADIEQVEGQVEVYFPRTQSWIAVRHPPYRVQAKDRLRTGAQSSASLTLPDGSRVLVGPASQLDVAQMQSSQIEFSLSLGSFKAWVTKHLSRRFQVRTPTAVCAVRGTQFLVTVAASKSTDLEVQEGVVAVKTLLGEELEVGDGRPARFIRILPDRPIDIPVRQPAGGKAASTGAGSVGASVASLHGAAAAPMSASDEFKKDVQREVALGLSKEAVQIAAAREARLAEYQEGKTLLDVNGHRVRLEEYVVRPAPDEFKLVALNSRADSFNYFYYQAQFNQTLPSDLRVAMQYLNGKDGAAPNFFVTAFETGRSNTIDTIQENGTGGHLVNAPLTQDQTVYDGTSNSFRTITAGTPFWSTLFDNYSYKIDGAEKFGWQPIGGPGVTSYDYVAGGINTRILGGGAACAVAGCATAGPVTCTALACEQAARPSTTSTPDGASVLHDRATISYAANGTQETYDFYVIGDDGRLATSADFGGATSGTAYKNTLLQFNYEQIITASEFNGRKIDLVVEPKILVKSGVIQ